MGINYQHIAARRNSDSSLRQAGGKAQELEMTHSMKPARFIGILVLLTALCSIQALAADTPAPSDTDIIITNNLTGTPDTVTIGNVTAGDIVRVYSAAQNPVPIGVAVAAGPSATVYISQIGTAAGNAYITVTSSGLGESSRTVVAYTAETRTTAPAATDITVQNNVMGTIDEVDVANLNAGDVVRAYPNGISTVALATAVSTVNSATLYFNQLGANAGTVYVTVQSANQLESTRTAAGYSSELSPSLATNAIVVTNNFYREAGGTQIVGTEDIVTVSGVSIGDIINVYKSATGTDQWAAPVTASGANITNNAVDVKISQLGTKAGKLCVTITNPGKAESKITTVAFGAESVTAAPLISRITISNNYNAPDTITVTTLDVGDVVKAFASASSLVPLASDTAISDTVTLTLASGVLSTAGGKVYLTVTSDSANESSRTGVTYDKEVVTDAPSASNIVVVNNYNTTDTVTVAGLTAGYVIKLYDAAAAAASFASGTAVSNTYVFTLNIGVLSAAGGKLYVSFSSPNANESIRTPVSYAKEVITNAPLASTITVTNNYGAADTVAVTALTAGDIVKVYASPTSAGPLVSGPAAGNSLTLSINAGVLASSGGKLYVSITSATANESGRTAVTYAKEVTTTAPLISAITVSNNYIIADTMTVSGLAVGNVVKVYAAATSTAPIASDTAIGNSVTLSFAPGVLSPTGGKIYVTVTSAVASESARTAVTYLSEKTIAPLPAAVVVMNKYYSETGGVQNAGTEDTVTVSDVVTGDIITIYKAPSGVDTWVNPLTVTSNGPATITINQLGAAAGKIYVTLTSADRTESTRTAIQYAAEPTTTALPATAVTVQNNYQIDDTITIVGVIAGQTVSVYTTQTGQPPIASTVSTVSTVTFTIDDGVLAAVGSKVYVTVKDVGKLESARTQQSYTPEVTAAPQTGNVLVVNYAGNSLDTVTIIRLNAGDTVTVYDKATAGGILASETVAGKGSTITLTTTLLDSGGTIYISVTNAGKAESKRTAITYDAS